MARQQGREDLLCEQYEFANDEEALCFLLHRQLTRPDPLNGFCRVLLALELEPSLREAARTRQRAGGSEKVPSTLTGDLGGEVRSRIAKLAGVSTGNVTKVKQVVAGCCSEMIAALRSGEVSIHRAHGWRDLAHNRQVERLQDLRSRRDVRDYIRGRLRRHSAKNTSRELTTGELARVLAERAAALVDVEVHVLPKGKRRILVTPDILEPEPGSRERARGGAILA